MRMSNFNAIHFRWLDPLTQQIKETIALVAPAENAVNICSFVALTARAPNQLVMLSSPPAARPASGAVSSALGGGSKPNLAFTPGKSAIDKLRAKAIFVPGAAPAATVTGRAVAALGHDLLAGMGFGGGHSDAAQEAEGGEGEEETAKK